jgi:hypothetical protein
MIHIVSVIDAEYCDATIDVQPKRGGTSGTQCQSAPLLLYTHPKYLLLCRGIRYLT